jgi:hypothetical protein
MISAQCDQLRERAKELRQGRWSDGADDAKLMEDAADTILSLRDRAQELQAENAKLRKYVAWLEKWALDHASFGLSADVQFELDMKRRELGVDE